MTSDPSRARRLLLALAICVVGFVAVIAWVTTSHASEKPLPRVTVSDTTTHANELSVPSDSGSERLDLSTSVGVSSRVGLPIDGVFLAGADGEWHPCSASDGRIERSELKDMTHICAPGHKGQRVDARAASIVLDVDAMLIVRSPGLKTCLSSGSPSWRSEAAFCSCVEFIDDDTLGCAVACALMRTDERNGTAAFDLEWNAGMTTHIQFHPESGKTVEWKTSCPRALPTGPLTLHVVRLGITDGHVIKILGRVEPTGMRSTDATSGPDSTPLQEDVAYPWGSIMTKWNAYDIANTTEISAADVSFGNVPLGADVSLTAQDVVDRGWGALAFVNGRTTHDLVIRPALTLHGKITTADQSPLPPRLEIAWFQRFSADANPAWTTSGGTFMVGSTGSWSISGPWQIRCGAASASVVPPFAQIEIKAPGFRTVMLTKTIGDVSDVDLEPTQLEPLAPDLVLHTRDEVGVGGINSGCEFSAQNAAGQVFTLRAARAWRRADGFVAVYCRRSSVYDPDSQQDSVATIARNSVRLVASTKWHEWRGFVRANDEMFQELDTETYQLELVLPKDSEKVWMRMTWFGIECDSALLRPSADKNRVEDVKMPVGPVKICWKCAKAGSTWSSELLMPGRQRFEHIACPAETK